MAEVFVAREEELQALHEELAAVHQGQPRVVLLDGPAGVGKTALLRQFLTSAGPACVATASGEEGEAHLAYGVVDQLVRAAPALGTSAGAGAGGGPALAAAADPVAVGSRLLDVLAALQFRGSAVVVVDDAHWADAPSLQALSFALRRLGADRVLTVLATRDDHPEHLGLVRRLVHRSGGRHLRVGGLDAPAVARLAETLTGRRLPRPAAERLTAHTSGRPLYVRALLEEYGADVLRRLPEPLPAPRSYDLVVLARLAHCSPEASGLVAAVAVVGQRAALGVACAVAGLDDPVPALTEAHQMSLLEVVDGATERQVAIPHPLTRAAIYHDLSPQRRQELHRAAPGRRRARAPGRPPPATS